MRGFDPRMAEVSLIPTAIVVVGALLLLLVAWFVVTQPIPPVRSVQRLANVQPERLERHVRVLVEGFFPRDHGHPENLDRAARYVRNEFKQTRGQVSEQVYEVAGKTYRNVIARFGPASAPRVIVGAHYDVYGEKPGANDNASSVAALIELTRVLDEASPSLPVELVAFTLEEPPYFRSRHMGSAVHADDLRQRGVQVRLMIALDEICRFSDQANSQRFPLPGLGALYPTEGNFIAVVGKLGSGREVRRVKRAMRGATALPVYSFNAPPALVPGIDFSDHLNYWLSSYPAVMVTDTSFMRSRSHHTRHDTPEKLDYERLAMVVEGVYGAILDWAGE